MSENVKFMGYRRSDGSVGVRNHVLVMPGALCAAVAAEKIARQVEGTSFLYNPNGCAQAPDDTQRTLSILSGLIANGNVYGAVIVGLGCESLQEKDYLEAIRRRTDKPVKYLRIQDHGLYETVALGAEMAAEMVRQAQECKREECDVSELIVGLECGGSDPTSGFSANNVLGVVSDRIVALGGTAVLSETPEAVGAEHILRERGRTPEIGQQIYDAVLNNVKMFADIGIDVHACNPSPGNMASGITTLEEKSLGCIHKAGSGLFEAVYTYGQTIDKKGLVFMDATAYDVASTLAKIAGGAQVVIFTTGMGNPVGCSMAPVMKVTGNRRTASVLGDIIDFDTSPSISGEKTTEELGQEMFEQLLRICEGESVKAEENQAFGVAIDPLHSYC